MANAIYNEIAFIAAYIHTMKTSTQLCVRIGFLCLLALLDGMVDSCLGPALRDLQCIFNVTQQKVSLFHPVISAGRVIGSLLFLKIPGRFNIYGVAATTMTTTCCILAIVPVIFSFWMALVLSGAAGLLNGIAIHATTVLSGELSKEHAGSIHVMNLAMTVGQLTGQLAISLFLSDNVYGLHNANHNGSVLYYDNTTFVSHNNRAHSQDELCYNFNSDVMYGFFVIASLAVLVFSCYLLAHQLFQEKIDMNENQLKEKSISSMSITDGIYLFCIMIYTTICGTMIFVYGQFLPTFGIHCKLYVSKKQMANVSISFYACIIIGRLLGTLSSLMISQIVLINVCTAGAIMISVMLIYVSEIDTTWLWVGTSILAVVCAPVFSAVQTWALDTSRHRSILYGISSIMDMVGYAVMSLLTGQLMSNIFVQMLNNVMLAVSLLQLLSITLLYLTVCQQVKSENQAYSYIE